MVSRSYLYTMLKKLLLILLLPLSAWAQKQSGGVNFTPSTWNVQAGDSTKLIQFNNNIKGDWPFLITRGYFNKYGAKGSDYVRKDYIFTDSHPINLGDTVNNSAWLYLDPQGYSINMQSVTPDFHGGQLYIDTTETALSHYSVSGTQALQMLGGYTPIVLENDNKRGLAYLAHPNFYSDLQIPDIRRVDSAITSHSLHPTNGLQTISPDSIGLGSPLTQNTPINGGGYIFTIADFIAGSAVFGLNMIDTTQSTVQMLTTGGTYTSRIQTAKGIPSIVKYKVISDGTQQSLTFDETGKMNVHDGFNHKGLEYDNSVTNSKFTAKTLITKSYTDSTAKAKADSVKGTITTPNLQAVTTQDSTTSHLIRFKIANPTTGTNEAGYIGMVNKPSAALSNFTIAGEYNGGNPSNIRLQVKRGGHIGFNIDSLPNSMMTVGYNTGYLDGNYQLRSRRLMNNIGGSGSEYFEVKQDSLYTYFNNLTGNGFKFVNPAGLQSAFIGQNATMILGGTSAGSTPELDLQNTAGATRTNIGYNGTTGFVGSVGSFPFELRTNGAARLSFNTAGSGTFSASPKAPSLILSTVSSGTAGTDSLLVKKSGDNTVYKIAANYYATSASLPVAANPTATAGKTAVNGSATTFMRSDGAPKVDTTSTGFVTVSGVNSKIAPYFPRLTTNNVFTGTNTEKNFYSTSSAPSISAGVGAGTSPTVTINGTNQDGVITLTVGTLPATGLLFQATMSGSFAYPNQCIPVFQANSATNQTLSGITLKASGSTTVFALSTDTVLVPGGIYSFYYHNGGY